jgi:hypothetical protein
MIAVFWATVQQALYSDSNWPKGESTSPKDAGPIPRML